MLNYDEFLKAYKKLYQDKETPLGVEVPDHERAKRCQICSTTGKMVYDHCHDTKLFRGWICNNCNTALGMVQDNVTILWLMIKYLMAFRSKLKLKAKLIRSQKREEIAQKPPLTLYT